MRILENHNLSKLNTFGINANAAFFTEITSEAELEELFNLPLFKENKKIFLGGGSNVLFTKDFDGFVVLNKLKGIKILEEDNVSVLIKAMGGEIWNDLVLFAINHEYWGIVGSRNGSFVKVFQNLYNHVAAYIRRRIRASCKNVAGFDHFNAVIRTVLGDNFYFVK